MNLKRFIPKAIKMLFFERYAINIYNKACEEAEMLHEQDEKHRRYYVVGTASGDLKVTSADEETRDRKRDKIITHPSVRSPYVLRRQSFYYTASSVCKKKYQPQGMQDFEKEEHKKMFVEWYFKKH